jgi:hypothetical protein
MSENDEYLYARRDQGRKKTSLGDYDDRLVRK